MQRNVKVKKLVVMAIFVAIIVVLQTLGSFIKFGSFSISLVLVPIVVGAAIHGAKTGAFYGAVFGLVVLINCISGVDIGGNVLWAANPLMTALLCLVKGALAGYVAGLVYTLVAKKNVYLGVICAAVVCPIVNTGIFLLALALFYHDILLQWAGGTNVAYYAFTGLAGVNFLLELGVNIVLSPAILRIINAAKRVKLNV